jgi:hypothetical protein
VTRPNRASLTILVVTGCGAALWVAFGAWVVPEVIESGWRGESLDIVNGAFSGRSDHSLEEYLADWHAVWPGLALNLLGLGALVALLARPETWALARRAFGSSGSEVFHATPKLAVGVVLFSLAVSEWYPFSQFPMYSTFGRSGVYVFLTDHGDEPIAAAADGGIGLDAVQKIFVANLEEERERRGLATHEWRLAGPHPKDEVVEAAAVRTLLYLRDARYSTRPPLRLWRTRITLEDGAIYRERELLGEVPAGEVPAK